MIECRIELREAMEAGCHPFRMYGRFAAGELVYALSCDGRCWSRLPNEEAETFGLRIVRDLAERACVPFFALTG